MRRENKCIYTRPYIYREISIFVDSQKNRRVAYTGKRLIFENLKKSAVVARAVNELRIHLGCVA